MLEPLAHSEDQSDVRQAITEMMKLNQEMESKNIPGLNIRKHVKVAQEREIMLQ